MTYRWDGGPPDYRNPYEGRTAPRHGPARNDDWARGVLLASGSVCFHAGPHRGKPAAECPECVATVLARRAHR